MTCVRCHQTVEDDSSFCRFCGAAVGTTTPRQLRRLPAEGKIAGVCAGIAEYLDADVTLVFVPEGTRTERTASSGKRLLRSTTNKTIAGVCGGLAEYLSVDATVVRVLFVALSIYPGAVLGGVIAYLMAWAVIPAPSSC